MVHQTPRLESVRNEKQYGISIHVLRMSIVFSSSCSMPRRSFLLDRFCSSTPPGSKSTGSPIGSENTVFDVVFKHLLKFTRGLPLEWKDCMLGTISVEPSIVRLSYKKNKQKLEVEFL